MARKIKVKPSQFQSKIGFIAGLLFCIIGCFVIIPVFGPFGIIWTAMAGFITFTHYKNAFTEEGMHTKEIIIEDEYQSDSIESRLAHLDSLYNKNLINSDEYAEKRKEILKDL